MMDPSQPIPPSEIAHIRRETLFNCARNRLMELGVYERFAECYWRDMLRNGWVLISRDNSSRPASYCAFEAHTKLYDALHFMGVFL